MSITPINAVLTRPVQFHGTELAAGTPVRARSPRSDGSIVIMTDELTGLRKRVRGDAVQLAPRDVLASPAGIYPISVAMPRRSGPYLVEVVLLDRYDEHGWQRITRERDGEHLGRLHTQVNGYPNHVLEYASGALPTMHDHFHGAIEALGQYLDDSEETPDA